MSLFIVALFLALLVFLLISYWKLYEKMGEKGWYSIVPFYSMYVLYRHTWGGNWWIPFFVPSILSGFQVYLIVAVNAVGGSVPVSPEVFGMISNITLIVLTFITNLNLYVAFGKGWFFSILGTLFPFITVPICALGDATYVGSRR